MAVQYHTLIHIGCGSQPDIELYTQLAESIILVDAAGSVASVLKKLEKKTSKTVTVLQKSVAASTRPVCFHEYNVSWANGFTPASEQLKRLYPGLTLLCQKEDTAISLPELLETLDLEDNASHLLILDLQEEAEAMLQQLAQTELLSCFAAIVLPYHRQAIRLAKLPLQLHPAADQLDARLTQALNQPDVYIVHPWQQQLHAQQSQIIQLQQQLKKQSSEKAQTEKALKNNKKNTQQLQKQIKSLQQNLNSASTKNAELQKKLEDTQKQLEQAQPQTHNTSLPLVQEQYSRQQLIEHEMLKAEAQLELIKDVLIRNQEF
ncbi:hypothetical protein PU634_08745 [Oceanimonas pelagia]|uniref:Uncharacterized protein n=1 Tax=Oceanimonas pelagia TaxID=3028314 RepID=A0AA50Q906_9GAMM|nr:hypothetical protein [Oceanimonas pelagia]WMC09218.1 hypothetical protein PU634_08745 [Oceanimonas pelagia]